MTREIRWRNSPTISRIRFLLCSNSRIIKNPNRRNSIMISSNEIETHECCRSIERSLSQILFFEIISKTIPIRLIDNWSKKCRFSMSGINFCVNSKEHSLPLACSGNYPWLSRKIYCTYVDSQECHITKLFLWNFNTLHKHNDNVHG